MYGFACDDIGIWPMNFYNVFVGLAQVKHVWSILEHFAWTSDLRRLSLAEFHWGWVHSTGFLGHQTKSDRSSRSIAGHRLRGGKGCGDLRCCTGPGAPPAPPAPRYIELCHFWPWDLQMTKLRHLDKQSKFITCPSHVHHIFLKSAWTRLSE